jgi:formate C-acetyltransferase
MAVNELVFIKKETTLAELKAALDNNWQGSEVLLQKIRRDPDHFGNNSDADAVTVDFLTRLAKHINFKPNSRGGIYTTALHSANAFMGHWRELGATPDGRRTGDEFTKNASVRPGSNFNGVTAVINSVLKLDPSDFMADFPLDIMLHPSAVAGEEGLLAMRSLLMTYIKRGGHAIHFNVFSSDMLKDAQAHPENYRDLQVRICGWNVLWNNLSTEEQNSYLEQAEANEELL